MVVKRGMVVKRAKTPHHGLLALIPVLPFLFLGMRGMGAGAIKKGRPEGSPARERHRLSYSNSITNALRPLSTLMRWGFGGSSLSSS